ncbi:MAG: hypothetical protein PHO56_05410, partial [Patescibacteria group bacterium]|nr:hypothetical protein [Patescibacteria group bacterium]
QKQKFLIGLLMLTMLLMYGSVPSVTEAISLKSVKDTISSSDVLKANVTHTIIASTTQAIGADGYIEVVFPAAFADISSTNVTCPGSGAYGGTGNTITCAYTGGLVPGLYTILLSGTTNPATVGSQLITINTRQTGGALIEHSTFRVAIVNSVAVTATVEASLTFTVSGLATTTAVNGVTTTGSSTYNTLAFGVLSPNVKKTLGQRLNVTTNANYGYTVTVAQDHNLLSSNGADIDSFKDGSAASTTPLAWASPAALLGNAHTYGHFGFTSGDTVLSDGNPFTGSLYKGFWGTTPVEVMYHNGPADGLTSGVGSSTVAYSIEISALQEAGDYSNTLTYVCTPTY